MCRRLYGGLRELVGGPLPLVEDGESLLSSIVYGVELLGLERDVCTVSITTMQFA